MKNIISAIFFTAQFCCLGQSVQTHFDNLDEARKQPQNVHSLEIHSYTRDEKLATDFAKFKNLNKLSLKALIIEDYANFFKELSKLPLLDTLELHQCPMITMVPEIGLMIRLKSLTIAESELEILSTNIGLLKKLTVLKLSENRIRYIPLEIGNLTNLIEFNVRGNYLSSISAVLCNLKKLETIDVVRNNIQELPACISEMNNLKNLYINRNGFKSFPADLNKLKLENISFSCIDNNDFQYRVFEITTLKSIAIWGGKIDSLPLAISALKDLNYLFLSDVEITHSSEVFTKLSELNIQKLYLHGASVAQIPKEIALLTSVEELKMIAYDNISYEAINNVANMSNIKRLTCNGYKDSLLPPEIGNLKHLQYLEIISRQLNTLPSEIGQLTSLEELKIMGVSFSVPNEIGMLKKLKKLSFSMCGIKKLPDEIGGLTALEELDLYHNELKVLPSTIGKLTMLKEITLSNNKLESLPKEITYLVQLETLELFDNNLSMLDSSMCNLTNLKRLNLSNNVSLTSLPVCIGELHKLEFLGLSRTQITELPMSLKTCSNLKIILLCTILVEDKHSINHHFKNKIHWSDNCKELENFKAAH